jgi:hypothetical protein
VASVVWTGTRKGTSSNPTRTSALHYTPYLVKYLPLNNYIDDFYKVRPFSAKHMYMYTEDSHRPDDTLCDNQDIPNEIENQAYINAFVNTSNLPAVFEFMTCIES